MRLHRTLLAAEGIEGRTALKSLTEETLEERREATSTTAFREVREIEAVKRRAATLTSKAATHLVSLAPLFAILVIFLAFLRVANHVVGFVQSLKLGLRLGVIRVKVRMKLLGALQISTLHIFLRYRFVNA